MFGLRLPELLIILAVLVLLFGAKKLPDLGDALGKGMRAFKKATDSAFDEDEPKGAKAEQNQLPDRSAPQAPPVPSKEPERKA